MVLTTLLFTTFFAAAQALPAPTGSICGNVQDENGAPAPGIVVAAIYLGPHSGIRPVSKTDLNGHYCIHDLSAGEYAVSAADPEKQYPDMSTMFYAVHLPGPRVELRAGTNEAHADFRIPYKAGKITIKLMDARTGKPITSMLFGMEIKAAPEQRYIHGSSDSTMPLLVPPNEDVYLTVTSTGYREWPDDGTKGRIINLLPGTTLELTIALEPLSP